MVYTHLHPPHKHPSHTHSSPIHKHPSHCHHDITKCTPHPLTSTPHRIFGGVNFDASLSPPKWNVYHSTLEGHKSSQGPHLIFIHVFTISDTWEEEGGGREGEGRGEGEGGGRGGRERGEGGGRGGEGEREREREKERERERRRRRMITKRRRRREEEQED